MGFQKKRRFGKAKQKTTGLPKKENESSKHCRKNFRLTAIELARFIYAISPCSPKYDGYRNVQPEEAEPSLQAALNYLKDESNQNA